MKEFLWQGLMAWLGMLFVDHYLRMVMARTRQGRYLNLPEELDLLDTKAVKQWFEINKPTVE